MKFKESLNYIEHLKLAWVTIVRHCVKMKNREPGYSSVVECLCNTCKALCSPWSIPMQASKFGRKNPVSVNLQENSKGPDSKLLGKSMFGAASR